MWTLRIVNIVYRCCLTKHRKLEWTLMTSKSMALTTGPWGALAKPAKEWTKTSTKSSVNTLRDGKTHRWLSSTCMRKSNATQYSRKKSIHTWNTSGTTSQLTISFQSLPAYSTAACVHVAGPCGYSTLQSVSLGMLPFASYLNVRPTALAVL